MESRLSQKQVQEVQANRSSPTYLCPSCSAAKRLKDHGVLLGVHLGAGVLGLILVCINRNLAPGWLLLNAFLFQLSIVLTILPHELGHAMMARALDFEVFDIIIGFGRKLWEGTIAGFPITVNSIPAGGLARTSPKERRHVRRKFFTIIAAGPLVNLLFAAVILVFVDRQKLFNIEYILDQASFRLLPATAFFYTNLIVLMINLLPFTHHFAVGPLSSDGKLLLTIPFWSETRVQELHLGWFLMKSAKGHQTSKTETANAFFDKAATLYPNHPHVRNGMGVRLLGEGKFAEARACFIDLMNGETAKPISRAMFMNNVAYADLMLADPALLDEADQYSQEAMTWLASSAPIKGTRGAVLLQLGRLDQSLPLLLASYAGQGDWAKAENACWLAILYTRQQNSAEAQRYLADAKRLNPRCGLIGRAEQELNKTA